jgi:glycosyltransferase A (GT-A) superfamily protein (DUF2064 family)
MIAVVLFARSPEREAAAKRIAGGAPLFRKVIAAWLRETVAAGARPVIACEPRDRDALAAIAPEVAREWIEQPRAAFGQRVWSATSEAFARGFERVVIAAIDAPPLRLAEALAVLSDGAAVIGPARDGGINFIGVVDTDRALLSNLTLDRCLAALPEAVVFEAATDVDSVASLNTARREKAWRGYFSAPLRLFEAAAVYPLRSGVSHPHTSRPPPAA